MDELFQQHIEWAECAALRWCRRNRVPEHCWCDCVQEVRIALWKSARRFDAARGTQFRHFFYGRLIGAIRDWLRVEDRKVKHSRTASDVPYVASIEETNAAGFRLGDSLRDEAKTSSDDSDLVERALRVLPVRHRHVMRMIFWSDFTAARIGAELGLSESRITQMFRESLLMMRRALDGPRASCPHTMPDIYSARRFGRRAS